MNYTLDNNRIRAYNESISPDFPKYVSQLINCANQNAQGTRPKVVGQMSELFPEFLSSGEEASLENWRRYYAEKQPEALATAARKIYAQVENLKEAIGKITPDMVERWVEDLVIDKTFNGFYVQKAILLSLSEKQGKPFRPSAPKDEARGIDGFVGDTPYSVKPDTYKAMTRLPESIDVKMIYYTKTKTGLSLEIED